MYVRRAKSRCRRAASFLLHRLLSTRLPPPLPSPRAVRALFFLRLHQRFDGCAVTRQRHTYICMMMMMMMKPQQRGIEHQRKTERERERGKIEEREERRTHMYMREKANSSFHSIPSASFPHLPADLDEQPSALGGVRIEREREKERERGTEEGFQERERKRKRREKKRKWRGEENTSRRRESIERGRGGRGGRLCFSASPSPLRLPHRFGSVRRCIVRLCLPLLFFLFSFLLSVLRLQVKAEEGGREGGKERERERGHWLAGAHLSISRPHPRSGRLTDLPWSALRPGAARLGWR